jgi:hypothetical protein
MKGSVEIIETWKCGVKIMCTQCPLLWIFKKEILLWNSGSIDCLLWNYAKWHHQPGNMGAVKPASLTTSVKQ